MLGVSDGQQSITGRKRRTVRSNYLRPIIHFLNSMKQLMKVRIDRPSMSIKQIFTLKPKTFIPISLDNSLFWSLFVVYNLKKQARRAEHKCRTAILQNGICRARPFNKDFSMAASGQRFTCLSYLMF